MYGGKRLTQCKFCYKTLPTSNESSYCNSSCLAKANHNISVLHSLRKAFQNPIVAAKDLGWITWGGWLEKWIE